MRSVKTPRRSIRPASPPPPASIEWRAMVDLVKIRKKAKKAAAASAEPVAQEPVAGSQSLVAEEAPAETEAPQLPATSNQLPATPAESKLEKFKETAGQRREGLVVEQQEQTA